MGLDVYLYNGDLNLHFGDTPDMPKGKYGPKRGDWFNKPRAEAKSQKYPEHLCERTYLRSSYNGGGFNSVVRNLLGRDLQEVFGPVISENGASPHEDDDAEEGNVATKRLSVDEVKTELRAALERARTLTHDLKAVRFPLGVARQSPTLLGNVKDVDEEEAIRITTRHLERGMKGGYSNHEGEFYNEKPLEVVAFVRGKDFMGPVIHAVFKRDLTWYVQACEIVEEFIEYALTLDDPRISWSG